MHKARKNLKYLIYNYKIPSTDLHETIPLNIRYLKDVEKTIGKLHDLTVASNTLKEMSFNGKESCLKKLFDKSVLTHSLCRKMGDKFYHKSLRANIDSVLSH
jgi:CHAD domain-containing protein